MDGVLVDFDKSLKKIGYPGPFHKKDENPEDKKRRWKFIADNAENFWGNADWLKDGKTLWNFIKPYNPTLLTSVGNSLSSKLGRGGKKGKERWVKRELGIKQLDRIIVVSSSGGKDKYANKNAILIDDSDKNIDAWKKAGGIGILHKTAVSTIFQLRKILK